MSDILNKYFKWYENHSKLNISNNNKDNYSLYMTSFSKIREKKSEENSKETNPLRKSSSALINNHKMNKIRKTIFNKKIFPRYLNIKNHNKSTSDNQTAPLQKFKKLAPIKNPERLESKMIKEEKINKLMNQLLNSTEEELNKINEIKIRNSMKSQIDQRKYLEVKLRLHPDEEKYYRISLFFK